MRTSAGVPSDRVGRASAAARLAVLGVVALLSASCGLGLPTRLDSPTGLAATPQHRAIDLSWSPVPGADAYHVYRATSEDGPFYAEGAFGPIPHAIVTAPGFTDEPLDPVQFTYQVSAVARFTGAESELSDRVTATSVEPEYAWQDAASLVALGGFPTTRVTVDRGASIVRGYALTVTDSTNARVAVRRITPTGTLSQVGGSFAEVDGQDIGVADLAVHGEHLWVAAADRTTSEVGIWHAGPGASTFVERLAGLPAAHPSRPLVRLASNGPDGLWLAYRGEAGALAAYSLSIGADGAVTADALAVAHDPTTDKAFVAWKEASGLIVLTDATGTVLTDSGGFDTGAASDPEVGATALAADGGLVYLLYRDSLAEATVLREYDPTGGTWSAASPPDLIGGSVESLGLAAAGGKRFALAAGGTTVTVRAFQ